MKKAIIYLSVALVVLATGCKKDKPNVDFSNIGTIAEISSSNINPTLNAPSSGLDYFNQATLPYIGADTTFDVTFDVNIASPNALSTDTKVTVGVDDTKRTAYNGANGSSFLAQPDSTYSFTVKSQVIKAGSRLATFKVTFYPQKLNPVLSYMLPISLTDASGLTISGNLSTIYLHIIGNPLAGSYTHEWIRYNTATQTGTPVADQITSSTFVPVSATTISVTSGTGVAYLLSFTNTNGVLSGFSVAFPSSGNGSASNAGITISAGPTIVLADPVNKKYTFNFGYINSSGSPRNITDKFY